MLAVLRLNPSERAFGGRGDTALAAACSAGQLAMIRFLINRYGGDGLVSPSSDGVTPWHLAKRSGITCHIMSFLYHVILESLLSSCHLSCYHVIMSSFMSMSSFVTFPSIHPSR